MTTPLATAPASSLGETGTTTLGGTAREAASSADDDREGEYLVYASLAVAIRFLFLHSSSPSCSSALVADEPMGTRFPLGKLPVGEAIATHTLHKLFLLCGIKRHHCQRFVESVLVQLLKLCFPNTVEATAVPAQSPLSPLTPAERRSSQASKHDSRRVGDSGAPTAVVRRLWFDEESWEASCRTPVTLETLLLSQANPQVKAMLSATPTAAALSSFSLAEAGTRGLGSGFVICVAQEAVEKIVSQLFVEQLRGQMMTVNPVPRWRMAVRLLNNGEVPVIILCGGTSGSGKSTLASLLAAQLSTGPVLSTDTVRQLLRTRVKREDAPELFESTYEAFKAARKDAGTERDPGNTPSEPTAKEVVEAYERQAALVLDALDKTLDNMIARGQSVIVEGAHLLPQYMVRKQRELWGRQVICFSVLVQIRKEARHRERFAVRAKCMTLKPTGNKYVSNFAHIRTIQSHFNAQAEHLPILNINNTNVDKSCMMVHYALLQLMEYVGTEGWPSREEQSIPVCAPTNVNAKRMLLYLREHKEQKKPTADPRRFPATSLLPRSCCSRHRQLDVRRQARGSSALSHSCAHVSGNAEALCSYCRALQLIASTVLARSRSAEVLTGPQCHRFDSPPREAEPKASARRRTPCHSTGGSAHSDVSGESEDHGGSSPKPKTTALLMDGPRRSYSYDGPASSSTRQSPLTQRIESKLGKEAGAALSTTATAELPKEPSENPENEDDETGSLIDVRH